jgi:hypothetical protein
VLPSVQDILMKVLLDDDPVTCLRRQLEEARELSAQERAWLGGLDADGLILTSLIVKKLRFERLTRADRGLAELFEHEPERFLALFRSYTAEVAPTAYFPGQEAALFRQWQEKGEQNHQPPPTKTPPVKNGG